MTDKFNLGLDIGSVSLNLALLDMQGEVIEDSYTRLKGRPIETTLRCLRELFKRYPIKRVQSAAATGSGGKVIAKALGITFVNELIAQARAEDALHPEVRTIIEIGGEDSKLIFLERDPRTGDMIIEDFAMNTICAAGTGSFLDQQASRLGVSIENEFGELALRSKNPPRVAGRCSVFAKSDMIHLQQQAAPDYDIVAGLCYAMARNLKSNLGKAREFSKPIAFQGGVAANKGLVRAFEDVLGLQSGELVIPHHFASMGAIGAILTAMDEAANKTGQADSQPQRRTATRFDSLEPLEEYLNTRHEAGHRLEPLAFAGDVTERHYVSSAAVKRGTPESARGETQSSERAGARAIDTEEPRVSPKKLGFWRAESESAGRGPAPALDEKRRVYLGIDVGSISTNVVAIDEERNLIARRYLMTAGRPIEAVRQGLKEIGDEIGDEAVVVGVGTTGSGRYLTGDFVGADIVRNEITAQATASAMIDPEVDTIFEIGGQDSKYISLEDGVVVDFEMNHVCAAGTGSFLEEQAEKLGINIVEEFGDLALGCESPLQLGERCTVFMESSLVHYQQNGAQLGELVAGLSYSIAQNYLNRVVGSRKIGDRIFLQGGVAANRGVVAAFEKVLGKEVIVPEHHDVTGAIGVAVLTMEHQQNSGAASSKFRGFDLSERDYEIRSFECGDCPNDCEIKEVTIEGEEPLYYGSRCDKYNLRRSSASAKKSANAPNLFAEREQMLLTAYQPRLTPPPTTPKPDIPSKGTIGVPRALFFHQLYPFWKAFFSELGYDVILSSRSNKKLIRRGVETVATEMCFPVKVAHGHILSLLEKGVDYLFLPSVINLESDNTNGCAPAQGNQDDGAASPRTYLCPYVQTIPYTVPAAIDFSKYSSTLLTPVIRFATSEGILKGLYPLEDQLAVSKKEIRRAFRVAQQTQKSFEEKLVKRGSEILESGGAYDNWRKIVIISRPYNGCDLGINLNLPEKLKDLGVLAIPMDFLPLDSVALSSDWSNMFWRYGQKIVKAAEIVRDAPKLNAIYITNFGCGPDSFLTTFTKKIMDGEPLLQLEIDEHSADAGVITRCEAYLDSLKNRELRLSKEESASNAKRRLFPEASRDGNHRVIYIPHMGEHAHAFAAAFRGSGLRAEVLPDSDEKSLDYGRRYALGKECIPCIITAGDMLRKLDEPGCSHERAAFLMPTGTGPCRFGQYSYLHRLILKDAGYNDVPIISPNQDRSFYQDFAMYLESDPTRKAWQGVVAVDILTKALLATRPYEATKGTSDGVFVKCLDRVCEALEHGDVFESMAECAEDFLSIEAERPPKSPKKPLIGIVGEIYVRSHDFSNRGIIRQLESLGAEVRLAAFAEWIYYTNFTRLRHSKEDGAYKQFVKNFLKDKVQKHDERRLAKPFLSHFEDILEPDTSVLLNYGNEYIDDSFEGEAIVSIGKSVEYFHNHACGIVNVMPFTCMPGTIVTAILKRVGQDCDHIPYISMAYDGQEQSNALTRLEAFVHQARQYREKMESGEVGKREMGK